jgi:hypothetical protein
MKPDLIASLLVRVNDPEAAQIEKTFMGLVVLARVISEAPTTIHPSGITCVFPT